MDNGDIGCDNNGDIGVCDCDLYDGCDLRDVMMVATTCSFSESVKCEITEIYGIINKQKKNKVHNKQKETMFGTIEFETVCV